MFLFIFALYFECSETSFTNYLQYITVTSYIIINQTTVSTVHCDFIGKYKNVSKSKSET